MKSSQLQNQRGRKTPRRTMLLFLIAGTMLLFALIRKINSSAQTVVTEQTNNPDEAGKTTVEKNPQNDARVMTSSGNTVPTNQPGRLERESIVKGVTSSDVMMRNKSLNEFKQTISLMESTDRSLNELLLLLQDMSGDEEAFAPLVAAAGAVGTPAVQAVFQKILLERSGDWKTFSAIVPVLGGLSAPTNETLDLLMRLTREGEGDFSSTAALALGASVHTMSETQPQRAERILGHFIAKLQNPQTDIEDLKEALAVLGNAGLAAAAGPIVVLTRHPRADVRSEAVMALRFVRTVQVEERLVQILELDPDIEVRLRAIDAMVHAPFRSDVRYVAQRLVEKSGVASKVLREKCVDLLVHLELSEQDKKELRDWALRRAAVEQDSTVKTQLLSAAEEFTRR